MKIGLQLYTVRDDTAKDFTGTLRQVAEMGYEGVEFAGYGDATAEEMRDLLNELGLEAFGSHVSLQRLEENLDEEIAYLKTVGARYVVCPYLTGEQLAGGEAFWLELFNKFNGIGQRLREEGLVLAYHNHAFEFERKINGEFVFDAMYNAVDSELLKVEIDLGWVQYAGQDPLAYIAKYAGRLPLLHLKDFRQGKPGEDIDTVELGQGDLALNDLIGAAEKAQVEWLIVEQDRCANPPLASVRTSIEWLRANGHKA
ncbi:sugar phosphate isomerase [Paenibacillus baekrokdamisoli]|uniref:Sugar phosphate isomerase n=1 Tax=Paenibacillus baekrokdamisoli TaxID=1712516 RepID=A0A3G9IU29_9BACL|nr:sugar phosphate isomerase/epimerase [Paenibacillus baekrokdamisoli]MBB3071740.1 sugar phosphate isomerase/epimerase [Paenibacillus baekrokdamisoli]BBH21752.1 sugar phosphate isomerase [Paenibacillus baekrokdamisoli]